MWGVWEGREGGGVCVCVCEERRVHAKIAKHTLACNDRNAHLSPQRSRRTHQPATIVTPRQTIKYTSAQTRGSGELGGAAVEHKITGSHAA